ncbi:hypothetical protein BaRGS_00017905, partial [Batillaria attramentaria]
LPRYPLLTEGRRTRQRHAQKACYSAMHWEENCAVAKDCASLSPGSAAKLPLPVRPRERGVSAALLVLL